MQTHDQIPFAEGLSLPISAVTTRFAHMGNIGSGKSYGAMKLGEGIMDAGGQLVVIDPVGIWYGLRLLPGGRKSDYEIPIFGGLHGDLPLEPTAGVMIADLIVDRKINAILDTSMFESDADLHRFASEFARRFFFRKKQVRSAVHLMLEEAQEFVPQNPQRDEIKTLHHFQRMLKLGRNFGIGASLISQRPQDVNKKAINLTECLVCYQMNGSQERERMKDWIVDKNLDVSLLEVLPTIPIGKPYIWSPRWLKVMAQFKVLKKRTADVSATPEHGDESALETVKLSESELAKLGDQIRATVEKAKASDPAELHKKISGLNAELAKAKKDISNMEGRIKTQEVPVLTQKDYERFSTAANDAVAKLSKEVTPLLIALGKASPRMPTPTPTIKIPNYYHPPPVHTPARKTAIPTGDEKLNKAERLILNCVGTYPGASKAKIAVMTRYVKTGGSFINAISSLRVKRFLDGGQGSDAYYLTEQGASAAGNIQPPPTGQALYESWMSDLNNHAEKEILRVLWECPHSRTSGMTAEEIAGLTSSKMTNQPYEASGGSFINAISALRTRELIAGRGQIKLSDQFVC